MIPSMLLTVSAHSWGSSPRKTALPPSPASTAPSSCVHTHAAPHPSLGCWPPSGIRIKQFRSWRELGHPLGASSPLIEAQRGVGAAQGHTALQGQMRGRNSAPRVSTQSSSGDTELSPLMSHSRTSPAQGPLLHLPVSPAPHPGQGPKKAAVFAKPRNK